MAALGGALLAKATNDKVDSLTHKTKVGQGPRAYQLRQPTEVLARMNNGRYDLGSRSPNPLNSSTFFNVDSRIDAFTGVKPAARPTYEHFCDCMIELNQLSRDQAELALAAYIKSRMDVARVAREQAANIREIGRRHIGFEDLINITEVFVHEAAEGGRRGEALVAAAFDTLHPEVTLPPINSPHAGDVRVMSGGALTLAVEVKQKRTDEAVGLELARVAKQLGATAALLVVFSRNHLPLDRDRIRFAAARDHGIAIAIAESVRELLHQIAVYSGSGTGPVIANLPLRFGERLAQHGVKNTSIKRWQQLVQGRAS